MRTKTMSVVTALMSLTLAVLFVSGQDVQDSQQAFAAPTTGVVENKPNVQNNDDVTIELVAPKVIYAT